MIQVTFREIASLLESAGSQVVAAEAHGCLCGALCASPDYTVERWIEELIAADGEDLDIEIPPDEALRLLFVDTHRALRGDEMEFEPLLPDDDVPLERRAIALSQWCQGFLYGFGTGKPIREADIKGAVEEVLRDFSHVARAAVDVGAAGEDEESAYAEVVEYVRVGVQLIHDELETVRNAVTADRDQDDDELDDDEFNNRQDAGLDDYDDDSIDRTH